jgi:hypothetical protein
MIICSWNDPHFQRWSNTHVVGFEALTEVVMKSFTFWCITSCGPVRINIYIGGTFRHHLQGWRTRQNCCCLRTHGHRNLWLEGLRKLKNPVNSSGIEPATFRLVVSIQEIFQNKHTYPWRVKALTHLLSGNRETRNFLHLRRPLDFSDWGDWGYHQTENRTWCSPKTSLMLCQPANCLIHGMFNVRVLTAESE